MDARPWLRATLAQVKAVERDDPAHGNAFKAYAGPTITGEIERYVRDHS
ncbi:hypothetical protein [Streptomyces sp. NPDC050504]